MGRAVAVKGRCRALVGIGWAMECTLGQEAGQRAQGREDLCAIGISHWAAVFVVGAVADMMQALDAPVVTNHAEQPFGVRAGFGARVDAGDTQNGFGALLAASDVAEVSVYAQDLSRAIEAHLLGRNGQRPEATDFYPAMFLLGGLGLRRMSRGEKRRLSGVAHVPEPKVDCLLT